MKKLALTFDDGPYGEHPQANGNWTNKVRRIVEDFNQKLETSTTNIQPITVTFFMQAEHIRRNPTTFRLIRDAGLYEIGNHAWIHGGWLQKKGNTPYLVEEDTAFEEFEKAHAEF